jgi:hypothetical protein
MTLLIVYIKRNVKNVWGGRYTLGARYLSKNTVHQNMTILTSVRNWIGQLDKSYVIAKGAWAVPRVDDHDC